MEEKAIRQYKLKQERDKRNYLKRRDEKLQKAKIFYEQHKEEMKAKRDKIRKEKELLLQLKEFDGFNYEIDTNNKKVSIKYNKEICISLLSSFLIYLNEYLQLKGYANYNI